MRVIQPPRIMTPRIMIFRAYPPVLYGIALILSLGLLLLLPLQDIKAQSDEAKTEDQQEGALDSSFENIRIAVIKMVPALRTSAVWSDYERQAKALNAELVQAYSAEESQLRDEAAEIEQQRALLDPLVLQEKTSALSEKIAKMQTSYNQRKQTLDERLALARSDMQNALTEAIRAVAQDLQLDLLLNDSNAEEVLVIYRNALDITSRVVEQLDQSMQTIDIPPMQPESAEASE